VSENKIVDVFENKSEILNDKLIIDSELQINLSKNSIKKETVFISAYPQSVHIKMIVPYIYIGSYWDASHIDVLNSMNIKNAINLSKETHGSWFSYKKFGIANMQINLHKKIDAELLNIYLIEIFNCVIDCINKKENILIFCKSGVVFAPLIVLYLLIKLKYYQKGIEIKNMNNSDKIKYFYEKYFFDYKYIDIDFLEKMLKYSNAI
jgi:hypothetical protein